ncbi:HPF/RaiA family ribosome-associated protein [Candidatus Binatia bacterium]|nr:HPF/RaiA family ribosome-associated protein [Candidatus Binatia bacterium]
MQVPLQISFRNMEPSAAVEAKVRERAAKLDRFHDRITGCRVVVEAPHKHHHQGKLFHVRIDLTVPGGELLVTRDPAQAHGHEDVYVAIRDAFAAARRQLDQYVAQRRGSVKAHAESPVGHVARLFPADGYGFIAVGDGREVYFHKNSVLGANFAKLAVGTPVTFVEEMGDKGPQASTVRLVGAGEP